MASLAAIAVQRSMSPEHKQAEQHLRDASEAWVHLIEEMGHLEATDADIIHAQGNLHDALALRHKYASHTRLIEAEVGSFSFNSNAVCVLHKKGASVKTDALGLCPVPALDQFCHDHSTLADLSFDGRTRSYAHQRLVFLERSFGLLACSSVSSVKVVSSVSVGSLVNDFYTCSKVDVHVHAAAAFSPSRLLSFMREKWEAERDTVVYKGQTLAQLCGELGIDLSRVTVADLGVHAGGDEGIGAQLFTRFDAFNKKYCPMGTEHLRAVFMKSENEIGGRFFAELLLRTIQDMERQPGLHAEYRLSVYGKHPQEWEKLAKWMRTKYQVPGGPPEGRDLTSPRVRWMIQIPRIFRLLVGKTVANFAEWTRNIFAPLFEATLNPEDNPDVDWLLSHIGALDSVDDETAAELPLQAVSAASITAGNPAYSYQLYVLWANLTVLNSLRASRGKNVIHLRPHCGESGDTTHLLGAFLLARSINHGVLLGRGDGMQAAVQYLYYLGQVGLGLSPLSNHFLFRKIHDETHGPHPLARLFRRGLNVTLSTDDPLMFHLSDSPLIEEYAVARAAFGLSRGDMAELARNSVLQSSFPDAWKRDTLDAPGLDCDDYALLTAGCSPSATLVPKVRAEFRVSVLRHELERLGVELPGRKHSLF
eukprot:TRINITY_DN40508_c0_g1_i1.p1 TRINITY_DN40508_c0_g1~~TRINITY_DN40508_c0_g1_i1.p1  ORF type:complete len:649 (+),score=204.18 TRINITY_DN40508_c0_g1_i1:83-2029(+)